MASVSSSPPSEGEIIESDTEKATTDFAFNEGKNINGNFRTRISVSRSPSPIRSPRPYKSRSASRSPYRQNRGLKRPFEDHNHDRFKRNSREIQPRYEHHASMDRSAVPHHPPTLDRHAVRDRDYRYDDRYSGGRSREKKPRMRSRSPGNPSVLSRQPWMHHKQSTRRDHKEISNREQRRGKDGQRDGAERKLSNIQSVSDRGQSPVATAQTKHEAEIINNQTQQSQNPPAQEHGQATAEYVLERTHRPNANRVYIAYFRPIQAKKPSASKPVNLPMRP